jgi:hypothetical protein
MFQLSAVNQMKWTYIFAIVLFAAHAAVPPLAAQDAGFLQSVQDLPLMEGLSEIEAESAVFDKPQGRIIDAVAVGQVDPEAIKSFYTATLAELGWSEAGEPSRETLLFLREGEKLEISVAPGPSKELVTVKFSISPSAALD